jgi:hypothetical protein
MMGRRMMLGEVVGLIGFFRLSVDNELALVNPVADPVETHVHGFGSALLDRVVGDAFSAFVVGLDGCGRLWMTEFLEGDAEAAGILRNVEQGPKLSFCCQGHVMFEDDTGDVYSPIGDCQVRRVMVAAEEEDAPCTGSCLRLGEIGRVALNSENLGAGGEPDFVVGVGAGIVEKLVQML